MKPNTRMGYAPLTHPTLSLNEALGLKNEVSRLIHLFQTLFYETQPVFHETQPVWNEVIKLIREN